MCAYSKTESHLLFGPQAVSFDEKYYRRIWALITKFRHNKWIIAALNGLEDDLDALCNAVPSIHLESSRGDLRILTQWVKTGKIIIEQLPDGKLPNIVLGPLTVLAQLSEYRHYTHTSQELYSPKVQVTGLCLGILSAMVVGCSSTDAEFSRCGAAAIRLAMIAGAVVDSDRASLGEDEYVSIVTGTRNTYDPATLDEVIGTCPNAYISVLYDSNRATVTCTKKSAPDLKQRLKDAGFTTNEIGLQGRFHHEVHTKVVDDIKALCRVYPLFRLPDASALKVPLHHDDAPYGADTATSQPLHETALSAILLKQSAWVGSFAHVSANMEENHDAFVVSFGPERCIPPSAIRPLGTRAFHFDDVDGGLPIASSIMDDDIAILGLSCKVAGADDASDFWHLLQEGKSQHREVPAERFGFDTVFRPEADSKRKWYGNFMNEYDMFDHKFFKKTPREASSMDPQQRHFLQGAYQAMAQSGYFAKPPAAREEHVGCYVGVCSTEYENNVSHHAPNAFSATGNLRGFIAGKVSHYFGWTGPSLTVDTACSGSAVAIHSACRAILNGECSLAVAGGTNFISSPILYQNLAAASFLSPTGQCKPFDAAADGYCRGEAVATVVLKKLSQAVADGDQVLGVISSTSVFQNENCTPIFVPNAPSLSGLFSHVLQTSAIEASDVSYVEAHGTGTPVGDPAEFESIRRVFGGNRSTTLQVGSAKGLVGHTESSSGVVSLIKVLLMMHEQKIPPQASFSALNPAIHLSSQDKMEISRAVKPWHMDNNFRAALINNYGASGSNASMIIKQAPSPRCFAPYKSAIAELPLAKYPFYITGWDDRGVRAYASRLRQVINTKRNTTSPGFTVEDVSFSLARQTNRYLGTAAIFSCQTLDDLDTSLATIEKGANGGAGQSLLVTPPSRPVILCFGGQVSTFVGLDEVVFQGVEVLRYHLDRCDDVARSIGADSIYPDIFQTAPIQDASKLQPMLFSMQYACAMSWIECGITPAGLVGHSFGELTALCISGILTLEDALKMVWGRSKVIRDSWGPEKGAMMALEAEKAVVDQLLAESRRDGITTATIACFNAPKSFTVAGSVAAIDAVSETLSTNQAFASTKSKRLNVTNAFHSTLVEGLRSELQGVGSSLTFLPATIPLERASESPDSGATFSEDYVAAHMRDPVYFSHAVKRLADKHPSAIWLEAGSNSTITTLASKALGGPKNCTFQAVNITSGSAWQQLTDATMNLWKAGSRVSHWAHSTRQTRRYKTVMLPPYQFDRQKHWIEFKAPPVVLEAKSQPAPISSGPTTLLSFLGYQDNKTSSPRFRINTEIEQYKSLIAAHIIANTAPICPATLQLEMAVQGITSIRPDLAGADRHPQICNVNNQSPVCINPSRELFLQYEESTSTSPEVHEWKFSIVSAEGQASSITHVTGEVRFHKVQADQDQHSLDFHRLQRLVNYEQCVEVLAGNQPDDDVIQGPSIYKIFSDVVEYGAIFQGLHKLVGRGNVSAGRVTKRREGKEHLDAILGDCFSQVGGVWVNCMANKSPTDMFIANGIEQWTRNPNLKHPTLPGTQEETWHVLARHTPISPGNVFLTDVFVFQPDTGLLVEVILGIRYAKVAKASMRKILTRMTPGAPQTLANDVPRPQEPAPRADSFSMTRDSETLEPSPATNVSPPMHNSQSENTNRTARVQILGRLKAVLADLTGLEVDEIADEVELADIGIDSLMGMEMAREIEQTFDCTLNNEDLMLVLDLPGLLSCLCAALGTPVDQALGWNEAQGSPSSGSDRTTSDMNTPSSTGATSVKGMSEAGGDPNDDHDELNLPSSLVLQAFGESKLRTDHLIQDHHWSGYLDKVMPKQTNLCVALTIEAFRDLGCDMFQAKPGDILQHVPFDPRHARLAEYLYQMLEDARIVDLDEGQIIRTAIPIPSKSSEEMLQQLLREHPKHHDVNRLTVWTGSKLADVLRGKTDGIKLIFGNEKGRELVAGLYGDYPLNKLSYQQVCDFITRLTDKLSEAGIGGTLKILEMGAGTGGTTKWLVPMIARLGIPVEYTFTDLSPSFVAAARKKFKEYPFMKFAVHDIEKPPSQAELFHSQHIVIASNAVHATHSLAVSTGNIHKFLRPDGLLLMVEMTSTLYWVDMIFGTLEGWWLFDDGRKHAITHESRWEEELHKVGYGHVDFTDGLSPEVAIQKVLIALASGLQLDRMAPSTGLSADHQTGTNLDARRIATDAYVKTHAAGFSMSEGPPGEMKQPEAVCVLITGATGSLGCHLVTHLASLPGVHSVYCLNRKVRGEEDGALARQMRALDSKRIIPDAFTLSKLRVLESDDTSRPRLGLSEGEYQELREHVTHVVHNAWPMSSKRSVRGFESQFVVMRQLIDLCAAISEHRSLQVAFQLVSSIAVVGHYPLVHNTPHIPEERMGIDSVLPNGYGDAKFVCERLLDETLHRFPQRFRAASVRLGQVAGSATSGYWNAMEHFSFLVKSAQTLRALPDLAGLASWTPVDDVAVVLADLLLLTPPSADTAGIVARPYFYHVDNPIRQRWSDVIPLLADALKIPRGRIVPMAEWLRRVRAFPGDAESDNPALKLVDFLQHDFERMSCGGVLLGVENTLQDSPRLRTVGPVSEQVIRRYIQAWKEAGFLR